MAGFTKELFTKGPLIVVGSGLALWALTGFTTLAVLGALGAGAYAGAKAFSPKARLLEQASAACDAVDVKSLEDLRGTLHRMKRTGGLERVGIQATEQFDRANEKFVSFRDVLGQRFSTGEMTYGRYLRSAEQVYLAVLDDLRKAGTMLEAIASVDEDYVQGQLRPLKRKDEPSDAERRQIETLEERLELRKSDLEKVTVLLSSNEKALTHLVSASSSLAGISTAEGLAQAGADKAMAELEDLAKRAERYSLEQSE